MRRVFFSFDYDDVRRAEQVRNAWSIHRPDQRAGYCDVAEREQVKRAGEDAIRRWIDSQLNGTSVTSVLIGKQTSESQWVRYEIEESAKRGNGLIGIYIHNVRDPLLVRRGQIATSSKGHNPFARIFRNHHEFVCYDWVNDSGYQNIGDWVEQAAQDAGRR